MVYDQRWIIKLFKFIFIIVVTHTHTLSYTHTRYMHMLSTMNEIWWSQAEDRSH